MLTTIVRFDVDGKIIDFNKDAERLLGFSRSEVVGRGLCETIRAGGGRGWQGDGKGSWERSARRPEDHGSVVVTAARRTASA